ncbi:MAG: prepilin-type N-terminal cleavage/methylation domain-containing protein [Patescibacteria group bacterium]
MEQKNKKGFTLMELLIIVGIIGILASLVFFRLNVARAKARDAMRLTDIDAIKKALSLYDAEYFKYPSSANCDGSNMHICESSVENSTWLADLDQYMPKQPHDPLQAQNPQAYRYRYQSFYEHLPIYCVDLPDDLCWYQETPYPYFKRLDGGKEELEPSPFILCFKLETNMRPTPNVYQIWDNHDLYCTGEW